MAGVNKIVRDQGKKSLYMDASAVIDATVSFNQGDLLMLDSGLLAAPAAETDGEFFLGIAEVTIVDGKLASPYVTDVDASQAISPIPGPVFNVVAKCVSKTGDAWVPGDLAYLDPGTGTRGVTRAGTKAIGVYQGKAHTAAAGDEVEILLGCRSPDDVLKF